jgi:hypothetical protein
LATAGAALAGALERAVRVEVERLSEARRQRQALTVFRHAHALRLALDDWRAVTREQE